MSSRGPSSWRRADVTTRGRVEPSWGRFVAGGVRVLAATRRVLPRRRPRHLVLGARGSGLSSSSALAVALTLALADLGGLRLESLDAAHLALAAEVEATGVPGGLMDQLAALFGQRRARAAHRLPDELDRTRCAIARDRSRSLVVHCGLPRTLAESAVRGAAGRVRSGRGGDSGSTPCATRPLDQVADDPRARHVVTENARVLATAAALAVGRPVAARSVAVSRATPASATTTGCRLPSSTRSSRILVQSGAAGARLTGAGFGGCVVALAQPQPRRRRARAVDHRATAPTTGLAPTGFVATRRRRGAHLTRAARVYIRPSSSRLLLLVLGGGDVTLVAEMRQLLDLLGHARRPRRGHGRGAAATVAASAACCGSPSDGRSRAARRRGGG